MKIDFKKIDFRQGKYWFPLVLFVPLVAIAYFSCEMFKGTGTQEEKMNIGKAVAIFRDIFRPGLTDIERGEAIKKYWIWKLTTALPRRKCCR